MAYIMGLQSIQTPTATPIVGVRKRMAAQVKSLRDGSTRVEFDVLVSTYTYFQRATCSKDRAFFQKLKWGVVVYPSAFK